MYLTISSKLYNNRLTNFYQDISILHVSQETSITMAPSTNPQPVYSKDEKVLCFHGELLYEAKILDSKVKDPNDKKDGYVYRVHYKGWKNTYVTARFPLLPTA